MYLAIVDWFSVECLFSVSVRHSSEIEKSCRDEIGINGDVISKPCFITGINSHSDEIITYPLFI